MRAPDLIVGTDHLTRVLRAGADQLGLVIDDDAIGELARRSRSSEWVARRLLHRVRDFAEAREVEAIDRPFVERACDRLEVDASGLDSFDRQYLGVLIELSVSGPVTVEQLARELGETVETLAMIEPYLVYRGYIECLGDERRLTDKGRTVVLHGT